MCSLVATSKRAGAEPEPKPFLGFVQSDSDLFADSDWLNVAGADVPSSAAFGYDDIGIIDDETPTVVATKIALAACTTSPMLSVTYTISDPDGLGALALNGTVGETWVSRSPRFGTGAIVVEFTEIFDLTSLQGPTPWSNVWLYVDVTDSGDAYRSHILDLDIDLENCSYTYF